MFERKAERQCCNKAGRWWTDCYDFCYFVRKYAYVGMLLYVKSINTRNY